MHGTSIEDPLSLGLHVFMICSSNGLSMPALGLDMCFFTLSLSLKNIYYKKKKEKKKRRNYSLPIVDYVTCPLFY